MLQEAYGKAAMKKTQVHEWHEHFHDGRASVNGGPCRRRPLALTDHETIEHVCSD
jgi:hypothetical protein